MRLDAAASPTTSIMSTGAASPVSLDTAVAAAAQPPPPPPVMADYQGQEPPDTKEGIEELCPVCGDKVSGYHYGLLTCESCKGFFKRTVQNKKVYTCVAERNCHIDKSQRKRCPFCRFQKCLDVGMKLEAVRADRMRGGRNKFGPMYKRDRARKLQLLRQKQMQQHTRPQCQLNPEVAGAGVGGNGAAGGGGGGGGGGPLTATTMASALVYVSGGPGNPMYATGGSQGGIKQEIQIPQLSSSTASPDSSSSPNNPMVLSNAHMANPSPNTLHSPPAEPHHKPAIAWVPPHTPGTPTSSTPSPHSPKGGFHYPEGTGAAGIPQHVGNGGGPGKIPALIREFQQSSQDDKEWQSQLFGLLQSQTYNQCEVDLFELMCKVLDQNLFAQVDWARNSLFFKDLKQVDDQMKLLQYSWSDMLILDHIHHRLHHNLPDETTLANGQKFDLLTLAVLGLPSLVDQFNELSAKMQELKLDSVDYICLKFMLLLNPEVRGLVNRKHIHEAHEQVKQALLDYAMNSYTQVQDKFAKMMQLLPEVHMLSLRGEEYLYYKHLNGSAPTQTLLMEMLHAKKK